MNFKTDDWKLVQFKAEEMIKNQRDLLENTTSAYRDKLIAIGQITALKKILNLPQDLELAAKGKKQ